VDVDLIGWVGVGLGGNYGCRCGILYVPMLGVVYYVGLVGLISSSSYPYPCSSELTEFTSPYSLNAQRGWHTSDGTPQMAHLRWHTSDGTPQMAHLRWHTSDGTPQMAHLR